MILSLGLYAQDASVKYNHPLKDVGISGSFGEYRNFNRYHMGLDYKTWTINGLKVFTPLDGTVFSMHVSEDVGYGNALFIKSANGISLSFAHLMDFNCVQEDNSISDMEYLRLALKVLTQDQNLRLKIPGFFSFKTGDCIARTGESGSGPPHLHFEMLQNGVFLDPLSEFGLPLDDKTAPELLHLYLETNDGLFKTRLVQKQGSSNTRVYVPESKIPTFSPSTILRVMIGGYDTMAARNRNGMYSFDLNMNQKNVYKKSLNRIRVSELSLSSQVYHTAYTTIGIEYVYLMFDANKGGYDLTKWSNEKQVTLEAVLGDASGNQSIVQFSLPLDQNIKQPEISKQSQPRLQNEVPFTHLYMGKNNVLSKQSKTANISVSFFGQALLMNGKARLLALNELPGAAKEKLFMPVLHTGQKKEVYKNQDAGFYLDGLDLYYKYGGHGTAEFVQTGSGKEGLYYFDRAKSSWRLLAHPYKKINGKNYYRFAVRFTGVVTQLEDISPPLFSRQFAWERPELLKDQKRVLEREYPVTEWGSGLDLSKTTVMIDGYNVPWKWVPDRSVIRLRWPVSMFTKPILVAIQTGDTVGNLSEWYTEIIDPAWEKKEIKKP